MLRDLRGLKSFCDDYPEAMCALLYRGEHRVRIDNIWCLPVDDFLRHLMPGEAPLAFVHE